MSIGAAPCRSVLRIVRLDGEIDLANAERTGDGLLGVVHESGTEAVLVDCRALTFLDASGLSMMLHVQHEADDTGIALAWSHLAGLPLRAVRLVGLADHLRLMG
jgi:anti-anti-sigma factor